MKIFCYYFPQFYSIPENDFHWGEGFTDWDNVKGAESLFEGHYQPRIPLNKNYYTQSKPEVMQEQINNAINSGISGFCFYHYWFDGKLVLEKPAENFLENKNQELEFCFSWANETWSKRWIGDDTTIILQQDHTPDEEIWTKHFEYLKKFFKDDRYLKINGRPVFIIYQPELIKKFEEMKKKWNELCQKEGIEEIHFIATKSHSFKNVNFIENNFSGIVNFQPREIYNSDVFKEKSVFNSKYLNFLRFFPEFILNILSKIKYKLSSYEIVNYEKIWSLIIEKAKIEDKQGTVPIYQSGFVGWDNTPRYGKKAKIYQESTPEKFGENLEKLIKIERNKGREFIMINAWNEWSEGAYLEPDEKYKYEYINKTKEAIKNAK